MSHFFIVLTAVSLIEAVGLSYAFDIQPLADKTGLARLVGAGGGLVPLLFVGPLVLLGLRDRAVMALGRRLLEVSVDRWRSAVIWALHGLAFAGYWVATDRLLSQPQPSSFSVAAWVLAGPTIPIGTWMAAAPTAASAPLIRRATPALALGAALALSVVAASSLSTALWPDLYPVILIPVHAALRVGLTDLVYEPEHQNVGTERFLVNIAPECSGLEGVALLVSLAVLMISTQPRKWSAARAAVLILGAILAAWLANVVRITALIAVGDAGYEAVALGGFHSKAGWVLYALVGLGLLVLGARWSTSDVAAADRGQYETRTSVDVFVGPIVVFTGVGLVTGLAATTAFDPRYGWRAVAAGLALIAANAATRERGLALADRNASGAPATAIALGVIAYGIWMPLAPSPVSRALVEGLGNLPTAEAGLWVGLRVLGAVIVVPWVEELAFRGYLLRRLKHRAFERVPFGGFRLGPAIGAAVAFAAVHEAVFAGALVGVVYAYAMAHGRRLRDAVIAHGTTNALIVLEAVVRWP